uniref:Uncharacterized protein n=1 Tax=Arundo donax TaxID=35708 RepID=A0A0A9GNY7_ARUDO
MSANSSHTVNVSNHLIYTQRVNRMRKRSRYKGNDLSIIQYQS